MLFSLLTIYFLKSFSILLLYFLKDSLKQVSEKALIQILLIVCYKQPMPSRDFKCKMFL